MGLSLEEYAELHPMGEPEQARQIREQTERDYKEQLQERQEVAQLKEDILSQLEQGTAPQFVLYEAVKVIGILTADPDWMDQATQILDGVYDDLRQESFLVDNAATAAQRLQDMQHQYNERLKRQLLTDLNRYKRIETALKEALKAVKEMEPDPEQ